MANEILTLNETIINNAKTSLPFTYLTVGKSLDNSVIGYTSGASSVVSFGEEEYIDLTIVYINDHSDTPQRQQILYNDQIIGRKKQIIKGSNTTTWIDDHPNLLNNLRLCPKTNGFKLFFRVNDILEVHDPFTPINNLAYRSAETEIQAHYQENLSRAYALLSKYISADQIGIYGSGVVGLATHNPKDIDILIVGKGNLPIVKALALEYPVWSMNKDKFGDFAMNAAKSNRDKISKIAIPGTNGAYCDIKVVPKPEEVVVSDILYKNKYISTYGEADISGVVVDDGETLSAPGGIVIRSEDGKEYNILNTSYEYCGAASEGDEITVKGQEINSLCNRRTIILSNTSQYLPPQTRHYLLNHNYNIFPQGLN